MEQFHTLFEQILAQNGLNSYINDHNTETFERYHHSVRWLHERKERCRAAR